MAATANANSADNRDTLLWFAVDFRELAEEAKRGEESIEENLPGRAALSRG